MEKIMGTFFGNKVKMALVLSFFVY